MAPAKVCNTKASAEAEHLTGIGRPSRAVKSRINARKAWPSRFRDDGRIPNNTDLPLIHYRGAVELSGATDPAAVFEEVFAGNGWRSSWRNGIYDYVHYHPRTHEVLGVANGKARVRFGGAKGKIVRLKAGDVVYGTPGAIHEQRSRGRRSLSAGRKIRGVRRLPNGTRTCCGHDSEGATAQKGSRLWSRRTTRQAMAPKACGRSRQSPCSKALISVQLRRYASEGRLRLWALSHRGGRATSKFREDVRLQRE